MYNTIKRLSMESVFENITFKTNNSEEEKVEQLCINVGKDEEFRRLFFFIDCNDFFYESKNEELIKEYLSKFFDISLFGSYTMIEYGQLLLDNGNSDYIEIKSHIGKTSISGRTLYETLYDEFLKEDRVIERLVNAENFYSEFDKVKKECLMYLYKMHTDIVKSQLESYKF